MHKWLQYVGWVFVWGTSLFFLQSGVQKLVGTELMIEQFRELGFPVWARVIIGCIEVSGAVMLAIPRSTVYAAFMLAVLMIGATGIEWMSDRSFEMLIAVQWLVMLLIIGFVRLRHKRNK